MPATASPSDTHARQRSVDQSSVTRRIVIFVDILERSAAELQRKPSIRHKPPQQNLPPRPQILAGHPPYRSPDAPSPASSRSNLACTVIAAPSSAFPTRRGVAQSSPPRWRVS